MLETRTPDLILADIRMPGLDGLAFARRVKTDTRWAHVPMIALTALGSRDDLRATWEDGFAAHVAWEKQLALLQESQQQLKASFDALASATLRATTEEFLKLADQKLGNLQKEAVGEIGKRQQALDELMKPIRDALIHVDSKLADSERGRMP